MGGLARPTIGVIAPKGAQELRRRPGGRPAEVRQAAQSELAGGSTALLIQEVEAQL